MPTRQLGGYSETGSCCQAKHPLRRATPSRREFLAVLGSATVLSLHGGVPEYLAAAAESALSHLKDTVLVVLQLTGGNDGLNTVIPFNHDEYRRARPKLAIPAADVLRINDELGFHPAARCLAELLQAGQLAVVQGVGYAQPNRSHFESMDIWHSCQRKGTGLRSTGWLGRFMDASRSLDAVDAPGMHVGSEKQPLAMSAIDVRVPSFVSPTRLQLQDGGNQPFRAAIREIAKARDGEPAELLGFLQSSTSSALVASERITSALRDYQTPVVYPDSDLAAKFKTIAQMIDAGLKTRVYYLELDGFDTHAQQPAAHTALLQQFGGALKAFVDDMAHHGHGQRVLVMVFSEFGRRVQENASEGTDHGAAAPMFLAGGRVRAGLATPHPSLTDLDDGDLKFQTDFRQVYATVLERWLGWPSQPVLGEAFSLLELV